MIFPKKLLTSIYTTKGRDRFHWAATPLKPHKVGNMCYMTYRFSVLYFLYLSLKHFFPHRKRQFLWKYPNPETVIVPCFNASRMPNRRTSQSKIEEFAELNDICPSYSGAKLSKIAQKWNGHWTVPFFTCKHRQTTFGPTGSLPFYVHCTASIC